MDISSFAKNKANQMVYNDGFVLISLDKPIPKLNDIYPIVRKISKKSKSEGKEIEVYYNFNASFEPDILFSLFNNFKIMKTEGNLNPIEIRIMMSEKLVGRENEVYDDYDITPPEYDIETVVNYSEIKSNFIKEMYISEKLGKLSGEELVRFNASIPVLNKIGILYMETNKTKFFFVISNLLSLRTGDDVMI